MEDFTGFQEHREPADAREITLDFVVFHGSLLENDFSKQQTKLWNIPLTVSEVIQRFALSVAGIDFERQIERSARGNDPKILIEHDERFSNRVDDGVRKYPGILDLGELFSEHVSEHGGHPRRGRESAELSLSGAPIPLPEIILLYAHNVRSATQFDALK